MKAVPPARLSFVLYSYPYFSSFMASMRALLAYRCSSIAVLAPSAFPAQIASAILRCCRTVSSTRLLRLSLPNSVTLKVMMGMSLGTTALCVHSAMH